MCIPKTNICISMYAVVLGHNHYSRLHAVLKFGFSFKRGERYEAEMHCRKRGHEEGYGEEKVGDVATEFSSDLSLK